MRSAVSRSTWIRLWLSAGISDFLERLKYHHHREHFLGNFVGGHNQTPIHVLFISAPLARRVSQPLSAIWRDWAFVRFLGRPAPALPPREPSRAAADLTSVGFIPLFSVPPAHTPQRQTCRELLIAQGWLHYPSCVGRLYLSGEMQSPHPNYLRT